MNEKLNVSIPVPSRFTSPFSALGILPQLSQQSCLSSLLFFSIPLTLAFENFAFGCLLSSTVNYLTRGALSYLGICMDDGGMNKQTSEQIILVWNWFDCVLVKDGGKPEYWHRFGCLPKSQHYWIWDQIVLSCGSYPVHSGMFCRFLDSTCYATCWVVIIHDIFRQCQMAPIW